MLKILDEDSPSYTTVKKRTVEFKRGKDSTEDGSRSGRPKTSTTDKQVDAIYRMVLDERRHTVQQIAKLIVINSGLVHSVLIETLGTNNLSARWVPRMLKLKNKLKTVNISRTLQIRFQASSKNFHYRLVTQEET